MKNKKLALFGTSALMTLALLAGCGGQKKKINFWTGFGASVSAVLEPLIKEFNAANPEYEVVHESKGGYDNLQQAINLSLSQSGYPHMAVGYPDHMAAYIMGNILLPLDSYIAGEDGIDLSDFNPDYLRENQTLSYQRGTDGKPDLTKPYTMGLPFNKSTELMVANQTFLDWMTTKDATIVMPETWQQARVVGQKMLAIMAAGDGEGLPYYEKLIGKNGHIVPAGTPAADVLLDLTTVKSNEFRPFSWDSGSNFFITIVRTWGGVYTERGETIRNGYIRFDSPETRAALTFFEEMADAQIIGVPQNWGESQYSTNPFNANKTVFTISSSAGVRNNVPPNERFQVTANPIPYNEGQPKQVISQGTNILLFDQGSDAEKAHAWKLMKYLTTSVNDKFAIGAAYYPVTKGMTTSETYTTFLNSTDGKGAADRIVIDAANVNVSVYDDAADGWTKFVDPGFYGSSAIRSAVGNIMTRVFNDSEKNIDQIIAETISGLQEYVQK